MSSFSPAAAEWRRRLERLGSLLQRYPFGSSAWRVRLEMQTRVLRFLLSQYGTCSELRLRNDDECSTGTVFMPTPTPGRSLGKSASDQRVLLRKIASNNERTPRGEEPSVDTPPLFFGRHYW